ncbi:MAG: hypothetical protein KGI08_10905 [Thaumarchaeota archaeon]|nr:hypothetical protein [Nitrososphaerota archaeon]
MKFDISQYSVDQLQAIDNALEAMQFKQDPMSEPFEQSYRANPKNFRRFINNMVDYKRALMAFFKKQYENRDRLIAVGSFVRADNYSRYLYDDEWQSYQDELATINEQYTKIAADLGAIALALLLGGASDFSSADIQKQIVTHSLKVAGTIQTTTMNRVKKAIEASIALGEDRAAFESRIQPIFVNPWRGRFIAQQESINAYMQGKSGLAAQQGLGYKTCLSAQATDQICGGINGQTVPVDSPFSNGLMLPTFHFGCRCDVAYSDSPNGPA